MRNKILFTTTADLFSAHITVSTLRYHSITPDKDRPLRLVAILTDM